MTRPHWILRALWRLDADAWDRLIFAAAVAVIVIVFVAGMTGYYE